MMKKTIKIVLLSTLFINLSWADGMDLYKNCVGCHGEQGELNALEKSTAIGGQAMEESLKQLIAYKNGELNQYGLGNIMNLQLLTLSEGDLQELATYIATLKGQIE